MSSLVAPGDELSFLENANVEFNNPEQLLIKREDISQLNKAIDNLPGFQKAVLLLFYKEELNLNEISTILEMPVNTVKSHLFRARNLLKELINKMK